MAGRALQGVGAAFMMPGTLSIISNAFPPAERGKAIGTWAGVSAIALALGPLVGGWLTEDVSWRAIFFLNLPVAAGAIAVTLFAAHESRDETVSRTVDIPGIAALTVGLTALVLALVEGNSWGWGSPEILALLATAVDLAWSRSSRSSAARPRPIVDFDFFRSRSFVGANVVAFAVSFSMLAMFFFLTLYMQNILGYSPLEAGVRFLPSTLIIIVAGPLAGPPDRPYRPAPADHGRAWCWSRSRCSGSRGCRSTQATRSCSPAFILMGVGMGLTMSPMSTAAMNAVDRTKAGVASGTLSMSRMVGGTFGVAVLGALVAAVGRHDLTQSLPRLPDATRERLVDGLGSGAGAQGAPAQVVDAAHVAFVDALGTALTLSAGAAALAAVLAWLLISPGRPAAPVAVPVEAEAEAAPVAA